MLDKMKLKIIEELLEHLQGSQGADLKALLDSAKPKEEPPGEEMIEGKPKGLSVEKIEVMGKPVNEEMLEEDKPDEDELSEEELEELLKRELG